MNRLSKVINNESKPTVCNWWVKVPGKDRGSKVVSFAKVVSVPA